MGTDVAYDLLNLYLCVRHRLRNMDYLTSTIYLLDTLVLLLIYDVEIFATFILSNCSCIRLEIFITLWSEVSIIYLSPLHTVARVL